MAIDYSGLVTSSNWSVTGNQQFQYKPIQFDTSVLAASYNAKLALSSLATTPQAPKNSSHGPAVIPPWKTDAKKSPSQAIVDARRTTNFIDLNSSTVKSAGNDKDTKALFALYSALTKLKAMADYAADPNTTSGLLKTLNTKFETGMSQVQNYVQSASLNKLTLMFGAKKSMLTSGAALSKDQATVTGNTVMTSSMGGTIPGLAGNEVFNLTVGTDTFTVDLSQVSQPPTLGTIAAYMNQKIAAVPRLDASGNPVLDANGNTLSKYATNFQVVPQGDGYALQVNGSVSEPVSFSAATADPSLYIAGNHTPVGGGTSTGTLMQVADLATTSPTTIFREDIAGQGPAPLTVSSSKSTSTSSLSASNSQLSAAADGSSASAVVAAITAASTSAISASGSATGSATASKTTVAKTSANATVTDSQGNVYVVGQTQGNEGNIINGATNQDVYLTKYDSTGKAVWSRLLGASDSASGYAVAVDSKDNVIISGQSTSAVDGATHVFSGNQAFVAKYDSQGTKTWTHQFDTLASSVGVAVTVDSSDNVIVAGQTSGQISNTATYGGGKDAFVAQLDSTSGSVLNTAQYGGAGNEFATSVTMASDGNIIVAGNENGHAVVHKLSSVDLSTTYSVDLGSLSTGSVAAVKVSGNSIYVAGTTDNTALAGTITAPAQGGSDGFVTMINDAGTSGSAAWTSYIGSTGTDQITGLQVSGGNVYVAGNTNGTLAGQTKSGSTDAIAAKIDGTTGSQVWAKQLGGVLGDTAPTSVAFSASGYSVLSKLGLPTGTIQTSQLHDIETQTSALPGENFYISINGGAKHKITIQKGDTFHDIASRINMLSFANLKASAGYSANGPTLQIKPLHDSNFQIFAGDGALNALPHLGMEPTKILSASVLYDAGGSSKKNKAGIDPNKLGGVFALSLQPNFNILDKTTAAYVSNQLSSAISEVERAFRSLTYDPVKAQLLKNSNISGTVPAYLTNQIASYKDALMRLQSMNGQSISA